jgi:hypothetical protein
MSTPSGDTLASLAQVQRLEELVQQQAIQLATLQQEAQFFRKGLGDLIDQQVEEASKRRGMQGSDYVNLSKFIARHMAFAVTDFKTTIQDIITTSIPVKTFQTLEKRLLAKPQATEDLASLSARISELETHLSSKLETHQQQNHPPSADPIEPQELETLRTHVMQLEQTLMKELQRAYTTVYTPKELGGPVGKLQAQMEILQQDIQSLKQNNTQTFAQTLITNAAAMLRHEFQDYMETRASSAELEVFRKDVRRVEDFSREVQTGFYAMRNTYQPLFETMKERFTVERWKELELQLKTKTEQALEEATKRSNYSLEFQSTKIQSFIDSAQQKLEATSAEIRAQYGPSMLEMHLQRLDTALKTRQETWTDQTEKYLTKRIVGMEKEIQQQTYTIKDFTEKTIAQVEGTSLQAKYAEFETSLQTYQTQISSWDKKIEHETKHHLKTLERLDEQRYAVKEDIKTVTHELQTIRHHIAETKQELKKELDTWLQDRQGQIQRRFTDASTEVQEVKDAFLLLKNDLLQEIQEHKQKEKYSEFQQTLESKLKAWSEGQTSYFQRRMIDFGKEIQQAIDSLQKREDQYAELYSEDTMRGFVEEVQYRLKASQDEWMRRKSEELQLQHSRMVRDIETIRTQIESAS